MYKYCGGFFHLCSYCLTVSKVFWQVLNFPNGYSLSKLLQGEMKAVSFKRRSGSIFLHMFCINLPPKRTRVWKMAWQWFGQWQPCILDILQSIIIWHYFTSLAVNCSGKERLKCIVHFYAITSVNSLAEWTRRAICAVHDWSWWTSPLDNCNLFTALAHWSARWQIQGGEGEGEVEAERMR